MLNIYETLNSLITILTVLFILFMILTSFSRELYFSEPIIKIRIGIPVLECVMIFSRIIIGIILREFNAVSEDAASLFYWILIVGLNYFRFIKVKEEKRDREDKEENRF